MSVYENVIEHPAPCNLPTPTHIGMARVKATMEDQGVNFNASYVFYGGHSLGGAMMPDYVLNNAESEVCEEKETLSYFIVLLTLFCYYEAVLK